jgi:hypothetical protein
MPNRTTPYGTRYSGLFNNMVDGTIDLYEHGTKVLTLDSTGLKVGNSDPYTLPLTDGSAGQILATDGSGAVAWAADAVE